MNNVYNIQYYNLVLALRLGWRSEYSNFFLVARYRFSLISCCNFPSCGAFGECTEDGSETCIGQACTTNPLCSCTDACYTGGSCDTCELFVCVLSIPKKVVCRCPQTIPHLLSLFYSLVSEGY